MAIGVTFFIIAILVVAVWLIIEFKRMRHKLLAIFLIALIIFTYISFTVSIRGKDIDFTTVEGFTHAGKLYLGWLGSVFSNMRSITSYAFKQDWKANETTIEKEESKRKIWEKLKSS